MNQRVIASADETKYTTAFYHQHLSGSARSAGVILGRLLDYLSPSSMLDVGCGHGTWLRSAQQLGIHELHGFDGSHVDKSALLIDPSHFTAKDLREEFTTAHRYDLTVSVEVAEHLPITRGAAFVRDLCRTSDIVLFSAATPYQGGEDHLNEQWPEYWGILFRQCGYRCFDLFRDEFWDNSEVESWYAQNAFLFVKADNLLCERLAKFSADGRVLSKIHPEIFLINVTRYRPDAIAQLEAELDGWRSVVSAFRSGKANLPELSYGHDGASSEINPFTGGRLNYEDSATVRAEIIAANAACIAAAEDQDRVIRKLREQRTEIREAADRERRSLRDERNSTLNALIDTSVRIHESKNEENEALAAAVAAGQNKIAELSHALDAVKRENALLHQASALPHVLARALPTPVKKVVRLIRDELDIRYLRSKSHFDSAWYLAQNPDVQAAGVDPIRHFIRYGAAEGRNPRADFDTKRFLANRAKTRRPRRNVFVEYLAWHNGQTQLKPIKSGESAAPVLTVTGRNANADGVGAEIAAWYGSKRLTNDQLFEGGARAQVDAATHDQQTQIIIDRYLTGLDTEDVLSPVNALAPLSLIRKALQDTTVNALVSPSAAVTTYTIITPFFAHLDFFRKTAESVERLIKATPTNGHVQRIEWIIVNDDPRFDAAALNEAIPAGIRSVTRIISDGLNRGISARQNQGIDAASNEWMLFLDCDDLIESHCVPVLDHYISQFPRCRFISSAIIDIDDNDVEIRRRIRAYGAEGLYENGMNAGHLAAIRRDLFDDIGKFDQRFSGCQDYDLALRVAIREPILLVPEHLYSYRWHTESQSVAQFKRQARISEAVRRAFLQHFMQHNWPETRSGDEGLSQDSRGACLIRTQGQRLELLEEAVNSVLQQTVPVTPCIVVHAGKAAFEIVKQWVGRFGDRVEILHADAPGRRRGYPLNVGLDFVEANAERFDFFCILDDDDIYYPMFAERLSAALRISGADIAYCMTNSRVPGQQPKSAHPPLPTAALVVGNFIPINAYVVRTGLLVKSGARMRDDIHYLEDWDFLLSLMCANARFAVLNETLSEFRIIGDGNTELKQDPEHFEHCRRIVNARGGLVAKHVGLERFYRDVLDFDFSARPSLLPQDRAHIQAALDLITLVARPLELNDK
ncbi:glycosyltransferase [Cupriavidus oxalaticus]|uniref:Glycosyltransferase n=1 Tax=Cupriavidus oxalaticus TaxID=96344 RepID=A0A5P3VM64_9BURK|nr:glycosyltransferase [Cupriavidus oxalaticus]QEZ47536.1 glycosyltransferase [Cupriavidus oxalaticus]